MGDMIQALEWDTAFFGFRVGRVVPPQLSSELLASAIDQARLKKIQLLYWLADPRQVGLGEVAHATGFRFMDFRMELERQPDSHAESVELNNRVRLFEQSDLSQLSSIAKKVHTDSRFALDPMLRGKSAELFERWIHKDTSIPEGAVFVADLGSGPCGYCTCQIQSAGVGQIGLIGVDNKSTGMGLGRDLMYAALGWFTAKHCERVRVVTQGANISAQRLYQASGFRTHSTGVWFHLAI